MKRLATFFVVGELIEKNPEILDKIVENEHEIGISYNAS